jgi:hypothetical protein
LNGWLPWQRGARRRSAGGVHPPGGS